MTGNVVLDSSVIVKWFDSSEEEFSRAVKLLTAISENKLHLVLPNCAPLEIVNVLRLGKKFPEEKTGQCLTALFDLKPEFIPLEKNLLSQVTSLIYTYDLTAYDSAFVAVANIGNCQLITADYKHHLKTISKNIVWLSES